MGKTTRTRAVQLAIGGSSPIPVLENLATDKNFIGRVIIDVTEGLFFSMPGSSEEKWALESVEQYKKQTPAQKSSFVINKGLESTFVFLEESMFGLTQLLADREIKNRKGVFSFPIFPKNLKRMTLGGNPAFLKYSCLTLQCNAPLKTSGLHLE